MPRTELGHGATREHSTYGRAMRCPCMMVVLRYAMSGTELACVVLPGQAVADMIAGKRVLREVGCLSAYQMSGTESGTGSVSAYAILGSDIDIGTLSARSVPGLLYQEGDGTTRVQPAVKVWYIAGNRLTADGLRPVLEALQTDDFVTQVRPHTLP
eukprot:2274056-Rhodomonas_salina.1